jgi:hypothetical protein
VSSDTSIYIVSVTAVEVTYEAGGDFVSEIASSKQRGAPEEALLMPGEATVSQATSMSLSATVKVSIGQNKSLIPIANVIT